jgi:ribose transport system ATP-binding protein
VTGDARPPLLRLSGVSKSYPGVRAVQEVDLEVRAGETLGLVGANGAGKSTLTRLISGAESPDAGEIEIDGKRVSMHSAADGLRNGVVLVPQALTVVPNLSVRENLVLGLERRPGRRSPAGKELSGVLARLGVEVDLGAKAGTLAPAVLKLLMIGAGLLREPRLLILDEPTAILPGPEVERLFTIVRDLCAEGQTIVYISHRLGEITALADRVAVMRSGRLVATESGVTETGRLAELMVGDIVEQPIRAQLAPTPSTTPPLIEVEGLARAPKVQPATFAVRPGEIVGLAGLVGAGRTSLVRTICGVDAADAGRVLIDGEEVTPRTPRQAIDAGIVQIPEDRTRLAILPRMTVAENVTIADKRPARIVSWLPILGPRTERAAVEGLLSSLRIEPPDCARLPAGSLSGGNQQKVVLARWLLREARVYVFDEPTEGIDVRARAQVHDLIRGLAERGVAVILSSSDVEEVALMSERVLVMRGGAIVEELVGEEITENAIGMASLREPASV